MTKIGTMNSAYGLLTVLMTQYVGGGTAIVLETDRGEPMGKLSLFDTLSSPNLPSNEFVVKTYSENSALANDAIASGLFEDTGLRTPISNFPIWRIKNGQS